MSRRIDFDSKKVSEAFKAGNRARKKESAQDNVQGIETMSMEEQVELFKEQTGIELEIRDGRPYFDRDLWLEGCAERLTSLPDGLKVRGHLSMRHCTGLTSLPVGLEVGEVLNLIGCTGLTSLPAGLKIGRNLYLQGCTGLTGLPFDLVVQGNWIMHKGILTPFFKKLGIPVDEKGDTMTASWRRWQRAHGYLTEAFRAGNRARKKETAADTAEGVDIMEAEIRRFEKETGLKLEVRDGRPYYKGYLSIECSTMPVFLPQNLEVSNSLSLEYSTGLESLPAGLTVHGSMFLSGCRNLKSLPPRLFIDDNLFLTDCIGLTSLPADLSFKNPGNISHVPGSLTSFFRSRAHIYVEAGGDVDTGIWMERRHHINEAFKAGNRARKKESVQDTVNIIDAVQAQINLFKEQTGIELEIRDGHPYFDGDLLLNGCTGLTGLPDNLEVEESLKLDDCTGLTGLPTGLKVNGYLSLERCTGLTGLPTGLKIGGNLYLDYCTGLTSLPDGLKVGGGLCLIGCTGLTSLPAGLKVGGNLRLEDCTGLTSLPFDLVVQGFWIMYSDTLIPFFKKLEIPFDKNGAIEARDWFEWRKANGYLTEAFRAGNRARKKETAQDAVGIFDDLLITPDRVRDYIGTDIRSVEKMCTNGSWRELINRLLSEVFDKPYNKVDTYVKHENGISISTYYYTGRESHIMVSGNNGYVMRLRVDGEGHPEKFTVGITFYDKGVRCLRPRGGDKEYETVLERDNWRRDDGYEFNDEGLLMFCQFLSTGVVPAGFAVRDAVLDEAFRAGNRARKKESIQDTVESVDKLQQQIDLFREQTGKELEIRDGRPYFDGNLVLFDCAGLTSLSNGLKVKGGISLTSCHELTSLPAGLEVGGGLRLDDCPGLISLPAGLEIGGRLFLRYCAGLTSLPFDLVVQGDWIKHYNTLTPFFKKLGIPVDGGGDTKAEDWRNWQKAHGYLTEAFSAGNKARKKEAMQDAAAVTDSVNLSFMDTIGEIESFLCRRGEQEDRVMTAEGDAIDSGKWFDWRGRTEDYQALVIEVENIDGDTCNVYVYVDATGVPSTFDATGQHRMDFECTRSLSNRAVLGNVLGIFDRLAGPAGEDELPEDLRDNEENWEIYKNLIRKHADFLQPFLCRQDLDRLVVDGVLDEAFKAGNRARRKESAQDTAESADRPVTFDETLGEIERLIHRIGSKYKRNLHNNLYSKQRPEAQAEIFHIHPFSSNELTDNDVSRDGFYPGGWPEKVIHSYDAVVDLAYFPELDRTFVMMCANVCTVDPGDIRHMSVFSSAGSYSEYYMGNYTDKDSLRDIDDYDLMGSEFFYPVDTISDLGRILEVVTYMLTDRKWLACMALFTVCRSFSSQYTRGLLPGAICPYIRKDLRISPEMLYSAVNGALWNELLAKTNGLCGAIVDGRYTYQEILSMFEPAEYRSESGQPKVLL